ncbi:uncharacterized protein LOC112049719 [Bicyclus anynana]|uniref:Uncharacterized protein LOC112049719 n=1 Tax=Bicyclus anynana TaxID=110368 RepID=A0A6J1NET8_BICAN|nr:uncharacterized protein LOC112049719 [Bicyclus anynana]XP_023943508.1 uncharacterized protein LOC112049719 [Bicyclus anynana]XP_052739752.1 uncharacterized protein LOC112049719 [Bicyclus anynana]
MVFSQTCLNTQRLLKLIEIDRLKSEKNQQVNSQNGGTTDVCTESFQLPATSFSEDYEYLKPEPIFQNAMLNDTDCEFFQELDLAWCDAPAREETVQSIDHPKSTDARAHTTDTLHTPFSPQGWDTVDASPSTHTYNTHGFPVPQSVDEMAQFNTELFHQPATNDKVPYQEVFLDFNTLPVVLADLAPEGAAQPWPATDLSWDTEYTKPITYDTLPFIHQDDSMDMKYVSVTPHEVESTMPSDLIIINEESAPAPPPPPRGALSVDVTRSAWPADLISTPDVLSVVEELETEKCPLLLSALPGLEQDISMEVTKFDESPIPTPVMYSLPITPKTESESEEDTKPPRRKRPRHDSEESDETYNPYTETHRVRKVARKAPKKDIKQMIQALEGVQQQPRKRGRPPGRRQSTMSTVSNTSSVSTHELKYRELRDKNNEASKRSRMNRKLKELQSEQLADDLEERNNKLKIRVELLEKMTTKLREAFMTAVQKKAG